MGLCKEDVTPLLTHWNYVSRVLTHWYATLLYSLDYPYSDVVKNSIFILVWPVWNIHQCYQVKWEPPPSGWLFISTWSLDFPGQRTLHLLNLLLPLQIWDMNQENENSWWRHQMETFSLLLAICAGNLLVTSAFPHKCQWRRALMFSLISAWTNGWLNNQGAGDLRHHHAYYDITVMWIIHSKPSSLFNGFG